MKEKKGKLLEKPQDLNINIDLDPQVAAVIEQLLWVYKDVLAWNYKKIQRDTNPHNKI